MPHGFFTVEQWKGADDKRWIPILHLDSHQSLTRAIEALQKRGEPSLYRVLQTQRCIWAEMKDGKLELHGSHVSSPEGLARLAELYVAEGGRRPVERAREERKRVKAKRKRRD